MLKPKRCERQPPKYQFTNFKDRFLERTTLLNTSANEWSNVYAMADKKAKLHEPDFAQIAR